MTHPSDDDWLADNELLEKLAAIEHDRWAQWQTYVHNKGTRNSDGSITLDRDLVDHWTTQIATPYKQLSETEKNSDREQVARYLPVIRNHLRQDRRSRP